MGDKRREKGKTKAKPDGLSGRGRGGGGAGDSCLNLLYNNLSEHC